MKNMMGAVCAIALASGVAQGQFVGGFGNGGTGGGRVFVGELNGGQTFFGLLTITGTEANATITADDIIGGIVPMNQQDRVVGLFNGQASNNPAVGSIDRTFATGIGLAEAAGGSGSNRTLGDGSELLNPFTSLTTISGGNQFRAVVVAFTGTGSLTFTNGGGTATFGTANAFDTGVVSVVPAPAAGVLFAAAGLGMVRRRR